ncbi:Gp37-like protein [Paeniglutamicibacter terrestris]|uniref:Gp28/Gp37-like domain-containing protein n=1 Tax=Paeniglutamicibacter terrestris TaxID=2723403 RepID=A0ABX1G4E6_9MICC|nr:hypothetical protein [Paeniglutamicibacter terrestris]NKG21115.1 hypothetical protein [Paeniglutamicibacter terrestris]
MADDLKITVYSKAFVRLGWIGRATSVGGTIIFNEVGEMTVAVDDDHPMMGALLTEGTRLVIEGYGLSLPLMSGPIMSVKAGRAAGAANRAEVTIRDDLMHIFGIVGWPVPGAAIGSQTTAYRVYTGSAEKIVKDMVTENKTRLGIPLTVAPNLNRGTTIAGGLAFRFHPTRDKLIPALEQAGLGMRCYQDGTNGLRFDVYEPATYPVALSEAAGTLRSWGYTRSAPTVTRVVSGGQGEGTARALGQQISTARETLWGYKLEGFVDARDSDDADEIAQRRSEILLEGATKEGLNVELAETEHFGYAKAPVGTRVTVNARAFTITDIIRSATIDYTPDNGLTATPQVGDMEDTPALKQAKITQALRRALNTIQRR